MNDRLQQQQGSSYSGIVKGGERWIKQREKPADGGQMINLGQGLPKRITSVQQQSIEDNGGDETQEGENGSRGETHTALTDNVVNEQPMADVSVDLSVGDTAAASEGEFTKVMGKRGRKQKSTGNTNSDSDEYPTGKVHREQTVVQQTMGGTLSESLDRITRSKSKQKKVSDQGECSTEMDYGGARDEVSGRSMSEKSWIDIIVWGLGLGV